MSKHRINKYIISLNLSLFFLPNSLLSSLNNILLIKFPFSVSNPTPMTKPTASFFDCNNFVPEYNIYF